MPKAITKKALQPLANSTKRAAEKASATTSLLPEPLATDMQVTLENLEQETMGASWYNALKGEFDTDYYKKVRGFFIPSSTREDLVRT